MNAIRIPPPRRYGLPTLKAYLMTIPDGIATSRMFEAFFRTFSHTRPIRART